MLLLGVVFYFYFYFFLNSNLPYAPQILFLKIIIVKDPPLHINIEARVRPFMVTHSFNLPLSPPPIENTLFGLIK